MNTKLSRFGVSYPSFRHDSFSPASRHYLGRIIHDEATNTFYYTDNIHAGQPPGNDAIFRPLRIQCDSQGKFDVFEKAALNASFLPKKDVIDGVETMYFADTAG